MGKKVARRSRYQVDDKVRSPWHPRKGHSVHVWGFGWVPERTGFALVMITLAIVILIIVL
jgi:hypothetical protein